MDHANALISVKKKLSGSSLKTKFKNRF